MIIAIINSSMKHGRGSDVFAHELAKSLSERHAVHVFAPLGRNIECTDYKVIKFNNKLNFIVKLQNIFTCILYIWKNKNHYDVINCHHAMLSLFLPSSRLITTYHGFTGRLNFMFGLRAAKWISKCIRRHFIARALKRSRAVTIVSRSLEPELHTAGIQSAIVIHNGVQFSPPHSKEHTYATGEYFLYLGRIDPDKFVGDLIDLYEQTQIDVPLLIAGDGAERTRLENSCQDARIRFIGHIDRTELPQLIERAKAFVTASAFETFCLPVIEAAAAGRPSIGPDSGAFPEVVRDGITGYLYSANDPQSFAHAIERIAAMSPADVQTMGNQCQNWAGNFSWPECVAKYEAVYDSVVRSSEV